MNPKKIKIILSIPLALFFIANLFYYPLPAKAKEVCKWYKAHDCTGLGTQFFINKAEEKCGITKPDEGDPLHLDYYSCCCKTVTPSGINDTMPKLNIPDIDLQIDIPGLNLTKGANILANCEKDEKGNPIRCSFPWIGEYIAGIYKYAIGIVGILAAVVLMIGGVIWITAGGNASRIGEAKAWIAASISGLVIALCSYTILYYVNPSLVNFNPLKITMVQKLKDLTKQYESKSCSTLSEEEKMNGFSSLVTGYCKPTTTTNYGDTDRKNFLCSVGLNCSCPAGRNSGANDCCNSKNLCWSSCKDFNDKNTEYCNKTTSGGEPGVGQIAADWSCFPKNSSICINKIDYKVTDKGSAIIGTKFDVWTDNCNQAYNLTGVYNAYLGSCK